MTTELERIDPEVRPAVAAMRAEYRWEVLYREGITSFRAQALRSAAEESMPEANPRVTSEDRWIPRPDAASRLRVRVHRPVNQASPLPCYLHIHGGIYMLGSVNGQDPFLAPLVEKLDCVIVSVDYRLAPEHPYPAAIDDCETALRWVSGRADELRIDPSRIVVGGASAGGGLAAALALRARDRGGPPIRLQYLVYPMLDDRCSTASSRAFGGDWPGLPTEASLVGWNAYLDGTAGDPGVPPDAAPARSTDLMGLPSAYVDCGELDALRDEAIDYATRLMAAGVPTELHIYPGVFHGWEVAAPDAAITVQALALRTRALRAALHPPSV